jgi:hypothetical protein
MSKTLYERLGGYDVISAVAADLLPRLQSDAALGRFWQNRGEDSRATSSRRSPAGQLAYTASISAWARGSTSIELPMRLVT